MKVTYIWENFLLVLSSYTTTFKGRGFRKIYFFVKEIVTCLLQM